MTIWIMGSVHYDCSVIRPNVALRVFTFVDELSRYLINVQRIQLMLIDW